MNGIITTNKYLGRFFILYIDQDNLDYNGEIVVNHEQKIEWLGIHQKINLVPISVKDIIWEDEPLNKKDVLETLNQNFDKYITNTMDYSSYDYSKKTHGKLN